MSEECESGVREEKRGEVGEVIELEEGEERK